MESGECSNGNKARNHVSTSDKVGQGVLKTQHVMYFLSSPLVPNYPHISLILLSEKNNLSKSPWFYHHFLATFNKVIS